MPGPNNHPTSIPPDLNTRVLALEEKFRKPLERHKIIAQQEREFASGILSVTTTFRLLVTGETSLKEIDRLIRILTVQKQILEESGDEGCPTADDVKGVLKPDVAT